MLVTAVITTHNRKDLVLNALKSVEQQTYSDMEIIVVDDKSTDGTKEILEDYIKDKPVRYIYCDEGLGGNHIRNIGILEAKGEWIAFLDDDDEWLPEKIEKQVSFTKENPDVGVVVCGRILRLDFDERKKSNLNQLPDGDYREKIFKGGFSPTSCLLTRKELLIQCGMFDESLKYWQEYELYMRLAQLTKFGSVRDFLVLFRFVSANDNSKRMTYNLSGWQESVDYINQKHKEKIERLPKEILHEYKLFITCDGCRRSERSGNKKELHRYLKNLYQLDPNGINLIRLLSNRFLTKDSLKNIIQKMFKSNSFSKWKRNEE